jgi:hypothetical protein
VCRPYSIQISDGLIAIWFLWFSSVSPCYVKKNTQTLIDASKEIGLEVNTEKTKYMSLSRHQNAGQNHDIKIGNRCFENVAQFRHLGTTKTNQNFIEDEIKRRLISSNSSVFLPAKNETIRIYKII